MTDRPPDKMAYAPISVLCSDCGNSMWREAHQLPIVVRCINSDCPSFQIRYEVGPFIPLTIRRVQGAPDAP